MAVLKEPSVLKKSVNPPSAVLKVPIVLLRSAPAPRRGVFVRSVGEKRSSADGSVEVASRHASN
jgi:hypothetical protein